MKTMMKAIIILQWNVVIKTLEIYPIMPAYAYTVYVYESFVNGWGI